MITITEIARSAGLSRKTVYKALTGKGSRTTLLKIKHAIYELTGGIVTVSDISMGKYSCNTFIKLLCKKIKCKKQGINAVYNYFSYDICDDVCGNYPSYSDSVPVFCVAL